MRNPVLHALRRTISAVLIAVGLALVAGAQAASAHPVVLFATPSLDSVVTDTPESVAVIFNEPVTITGHALTLLDDQGRELALGPPETQKDGTAITASIEDDLERGSYLVRWEAIGADGHGAGGEFRFAVGTAVAADGTPAGSGWAETDWPDAVSNAVLVAGFVIAAGGLAAGRIVAPLQAGDRRLPAFASWTGFGAIIGVVGATGAAAWLTIALGSAQSVWGSIPGQVVIVEAVGFGATLLVLASRARPWPWALLPLAAVPIAEGVGSHAQIVESPGGAVLTAVHMAAAGLWVGTLVHVLRITLRWREYPAAVRAMWWGYARLTFWVVLILLATGTVMALLLVPVELLFVSAYGTVLLVKVALVAGAVALAVAGRWLLGRRRITVLRRTVPAETFTLTLVLLASATLAAMPTPDPAAAVVPPAPVRGVAIPAGGLAGQVGVNLVASEGQIVARLYTPTLENAYEPGQEPQEFTLSGSVEQPGRMPDRVPFRSCGANCFVGEVTWHEGDNVLVLRADAEGWQGGTHATLITWPAQQADDLVERTVEVMSEVGEFTLYEAGTSNTAYPLPDPMKLDVDGEHYIANEPYNSGVAPVAATTTDSNGNTQLHVGFPASGVSARLTLDGLGRVVEETLSGPKTEFHRRFVYP